MFGVEVDGKHMLFGKAHRRNGFIIGTMAMNLHPLQKVLVS